MLIAGATLLVGLAVIVYWTILVPRWQLDDYRPSVYVMVMVIAGLGMLAWSSWEDRPQYSYNQTRDPLAIAIAFDLSPSMLAIPDPTIMPDEVSRFERGRTVLNRLFRVLEDRQEDIIVSIMGFTEKAEVIMGWESNITQIREMLDYVVSPDLFTGTGTSIEAGINALSDSFGTLPDELRENSHKIGILISDGEDTLPYSYLEYVVEKIEAGNFDIVALQTGLLGQDEGVPEYGEFGEFLSFQPMSGRLYTIPDVDAMMQISDIDNHRGLYVRAESANAADSLVEFVGGMRLLDGGLDARVLALLGLFLVTLLLMVRQLL